jgi:hypothetical protein
MQVHGDFAFSAPPQPQPSHYNNIVVSWTFLPGPPNPPPTTHHLPVGCCQVPVTLRRSQTRLLWAPNATVAAVLRANLSNALGVVHLGASDAEVQEAVGAMLPAHVVHLGPLVPGVVGPVQDVAARKEVARRQTVGDMATSRHIVDRGLQAQ